MLSFCIYKVISSAKNMCSLFKINKHSSSAKNMCSVFIVSKQSSSASDMGSMEKSLPLAPCKKIAGLSEVQQARKGKGRSAHEGKKLV